MKQRRQCPKCGHKQLQHIRVRGIRKCAHCGNLVDVRRRNWFINLLSA